jgi:hypothetical protein
MTRYAIEVGFIYDLDKSAVMCTGSSHFGKRWGKRSEWSISKGREIGFVVNASGKEGKERESKTNPVNLSFPISLE